MTTRWIGALLAAALLWPLAARAEDPPVDTKALAEQRAQVADKLAEAEKLAANNLSPEQKQALTAKIKKYRDTLAKLDAQLAKAGGGAAPVAAAGAGAANPSLTPEQQKELVQTERLIKALLNRIQARADEIKRTPKDEPLVAAQPGGVPGNVQPGMPGGPPPGMPPGAAPGGPPGMAPGGMPPGMPGPGGMPPGMEGGAVPQQPTTKRQRLEQEQRDDLNKLAELQKRLNELKSGPRDVDPLAAENLPELHPLVLYGGSVEKNPYGLKIGTWGSGQVSEDNHGMLEGMKSLLVYTYGYYRGARLDFAKPPAIKQYFEQPDLSYVQMDVVFFPKQETNPTTGPGAMPGMEGQPGGMPPGMEGQPGGMPPGMPGPGGMPPGAPPAGMPPGMPPGGMPPGMAGAPPGMAPGAPPGGMPGMAPPGEPGMMPGMPGAQPGMEGQPGAGAAPAAAPVKAAPATRSLRLVLDTDQGPVVAEDVYFDYTYEVHPGWTRVFVPLKDFVLVNERKPEELKRLRLFGDTQDAFYVGMVRFVRDEVAIKPTILGPQEVDAVAGEEIKLEAVAEAGLSVVEYTWDWGDGESDDTPDPVGKHLYVKAGKYTVTLVAKDKDKLKPEGKTTVIVSVKPFATLPKAPAQPAGMPGMMAP